MGRRNKRHRRDRSVSREQNIFWYGFKAVIMQYVGVFIVLGSLFLLQYHYILTIIVAIIGIGIFIQGKAMRFEYKMKSGHIIHGGDR